MPTIHLPDIAATERLGQELAASVSFGDCIALDGPLGAGKTSLVRALVCALGGDQEAVASPTFTLMNRYEANWPIFHVDAYRLQGANALAGLGFDELSETGLGIVEWASLVPGALPDAYTWHIALEHHANGRQVTIVAPPGRDVPWLQAWPTS